MCQPCRPSVGEDSHSVVLCCHSDICCRNFLSVGKAIYSNHSMSLSKGMNNGVWSKGDGTKLDCALCHLRNLTVTLDCRHLVVHTSCLIEDLTMSECSVKHMLSSLKRFCKKKKSYFPLPNGDTRLLWKGSQKESQKEVTTRSSHRGECSR